MAKTVTHYLCRACGGVQARWMGKCPDCGAWDALEQFVEPKATVAAAHGEVARAWVADPATGSERPGAEPLAEVAPPDVVRRPTGIGELDRVLGGGLVAGSVVLLGGDPGIGKSTLLLQTAAALARDGHRILYVSSEESADQTRLRAERLLGDLGAIDNIDRLLVLAETDLARILEQTRQVRPAALFLDSIQMVFKADLDAAPGSVAQLRRCSTELVYLAKAAGLTVVLVGHVTKDGQLAGPKLIEHLVDAVLTFDGDRHHAHRVVRAVKNRFGTTMEIGLFEMTGRGLAELDDLGRGDPTDVPQPGCVVCPVLHGSRCLLVEVQALTATGFPGSTKRRTSGLDPNRLAMIIAVLEKHAGLRLSDQDVFTATTGGLKVSEPAADLAMALAIAGAHLRRRLPARTAAIGEVSLGGDVRRAPGLEQRIREARRLGFERVITTSDGVSEESGVIFVKTISEAVEALMT